MRKARRWALLAGALAVAVVAVGVAVVWHGRAAPPPSPGATASTETAASAPRFLGSDACAGCHSREAEAWAGSQHARAMQPATERTVAGDFANRRFDDAGAGGTATFFRRDGKFLVRTAGPDGKPADFEVRYTFGVEPLQQYLVELPGGRLQALTVAWDTANRRWFSLYPRDRLAAGDALHWTGIQQNWNFMCADCHSTDVRKGYDAGAKAFATTWAEMHVGCEACHGPGSNHVAWAERRGADPGKGLTAALDERAGVRWTIDPQTGNAVRSRSRDTDREIEVCAQCHARRAQIAEGYRAGARFLDHYVPALVTPPLYYADGQQREEVYNWGSFLQSRMYRHGVTCSDCHDPHTGKPRAEGNALCAQCHSAAKYDAAAHHRHHPGSAGAQCVGCHMPNATYMVVDPRRDHGIRVPRPDLTASLGVPNACNGCHEGKDATWAADAVRGWYGRDAQGMQRFAATFRNAELDKPRAGASLAALAADPSQPAIVRASALDRLRTAPAAEAPAAARAAAGNANPLLRLAAAQLAEALPAGERIAVAGPLLDDPLRAVRVEAAGALAGIPADRLSPAQREAWRRAADDYVAAQRYNAERPEARTNLGSFYARTGRHDEAQAEFAAAIALDRGYVPAYVNAADAWREQGREGDAIRTLREGIAAAPAAAALHHALGLAYVRAGERAPALAELARAVELAPDDPRYAYVHAIALNSAGRAPEAIRALERAASRWPANRDIVFGLAAIQRDAGRRGEALRTAQNLLALDPADGDARALVEQLKPSAPK